ncbi:hypothetical protein, partial [Streptomyces sp. NPDC054783]
DYARTHGVCLKVRSNRTAIGPQTWIGHSRHASGPTPGDSWAPDGRVYPIAGVTGHSGLVRCVLRRITPDHVLRLLRELVERETEVELRRYGNLGTEDAGDIALTLPAESVEVVRELLADADRGIRLDEAHWTSNLARLSVVGVGIGRRPSAPLRLLEALRSVGAARTDLHVTSNKLSVLTGESDLAQATQIVHDTFVSEPAMPRIHPTGPDHAGTTWSPATERGRLNGAVPALAAAE